MPTQWDLVLRGRRIIMISNHRSVRVAIAIALGAGALILLPGTAAATETSPSHDAAIQPVAAAHSDPGPLEDAANEVDDATDRVDRAADDLSGGTVDTRPTTEAADDVVRSTARQGDKVLAPILSEPDPDDPATDRPAPAGGIETSSRSVGSVAGIGIGPRDPDATSPAEFDALPAGRPLALEDSSETAMNRAPEGSGGWALTLPGASFPLLLAVAMLAFLGLYRVGRDDPKLALAPVHRDSEMVLFS